jgi:hypothetical protein
VNDAHAASDRKPSGLDTSVAHNARVWNYWLGGKDNFEADRAGAVRFLPTQAGIRQFLDIGTGLPTADNTHEVAQRLVPESRVVYVDNDPGLVPCTQWRPDPVDVGEEASRFRSTPGLRANPDARAREGSRPAERWPAER